MASHLTLVVMNCAGWIALHNVFRLPGSCGDFTAVRALELRLYGVDPAITGKSSEEQYSSRCGDAQ